MFEIQGNVYPEGYVANDALLLSHDDIPDYDAMTDAEIAARADRVFGGWIAYLIEEAGDWQAQRMESGAWALIYGRSAWAVAPGRYEFTDDNGNTEAGTIYDVVADVCEVTHERARRIVQMWVDDAEHEPGWKPGSTRDNIPLKPCPLVQVLPLGDVVVFDAMFDAGTPAGHYDIMAGVIARYRSKMDVEAVARDTDIMDVRGLLHDVTDYINKTSIYPQPELALAATIPALGALMGRRVATETDLRSSVYTIGVAGSGQGKNAALVAIKKLFAAADLMPYIGGSPTADSSINSDLVDHPVKFLASDEFGKFFEQMQHKNAAPTQRAVLDRWTEVWSAGSSFIQTKAYADRRTRPIETIHNPHICIYGATVPGPLWKALSSGSLSDGSLARFLLFTPAKEFVYRRDVYGSTEPPQELVDALAAVPSLIPSHPEAGNLEKTMSHDVRMRPYIVPFTDKARAFNSVVGRYQDKRAHANRANDGIQALWARLAEQAGRLALIQAVAENPRNPVIELRHMHWGVAVAMKCIQTMVDQASKHISDNDAEAEVKRVLNIILDTKEKGIPLSGSGSLTAKTRFIRNSARRREILQNLQNSEDIEAVIVRRDGSRKAGASLFGREYAPPGVRAQL